jgi:hypothetical protein
MFRLSDIYSENDDVLWPVGQKLRQILCLFHQSWAILDNLRGPVLLSPPILIKRKGAFQFLCTSSEHMRHILFFNRRYFPSSERDGWIERPPCGDLIRNCLPGWIRISSPAGNIIPARGPATKRIQAQIQFGYNYGLW